MLKNANIILALYSAACSLATAFALACLTYTLYTGDLPFDIQPIFPTPDQVNEKPAGTEKTEGTATAPASTGKETMRVTEKAALQLFEELRKTESILKRKEEKLTQLQSELNAREKHLQKLEKIIHKEAEDIKLRLEVIAKRDLANIQEQAKLLEEIEPKAASKLILEWEKDQAKNRNGRLAPRVLYYMNKAKAAEILGVLLKENDPEKRRIVGEITETMRRLAPEEEIVNATQKQP
ncbi:MAG: hypothetical protein D6820_10135 [Lentisphaerae bacterium]|nr:MAG: hypothetical protein D6820_10135 [Lentisphaerota bacterium]